MNEKPFIFEEALRRIEEIVNALEKGDVSLKESMALFEEGTTLIRKCSDELDSAEQQVVQLKKNADGVPEELPFVPDENAN